MGHGGEQKTGKLGQSYSVMPGWGSGCEIGDRQIISVPLTLTTLRKHLTSVKVFIVL